MNLGNKLSGSPIDMFTSSSGDGMISISQARLSNFRKLVDTYCVDSIDTARTLVLLADGANETEYNIMLGYMLDNLDEHPNLTAKELFILAQILMTLMVSCECICEQVMGKFSDVISKLEYRLAYKLACDDPYLNALNYKMRAILSVYNDIKVRWLDMNRCATSFHPHTSLDIERCRTATVNTESINVNGDNVGRVQVRDPNEDMMYRHSFATDYDDISEFVTYLKTKAMSPCALNYDDIAYLLRRANQFPDYVDAIFSSNSVDEEFLNYPIYIFDKFSSLCFNKDTAEKIYNIAEETVNRINMITFLTYEAKNAANNFINFINGEFKTWAQTCLDKPDANPCPDPIVTMGLEGLYDALPESEVAITEATACDIINKINEIGVRDNYSSNLIKLPELFNEGAYIDYRNERRRIKYNYKNEKLQNKLNKKLEDQKVAANDKDSNKIIKAEQIRAIPLTDSGMGTIMRTLKKLIGAALLAAGGVAIGQPVIAAVASCMYAISAFGRKSRNFEHRQKIATDLSNEINRIDAKIEECNAKGLTKASAQLGQMKANLQRTQTKLVATTRDHGGALYT